MKRLLIGIGLAAAFLYIFSCGKTNTPAPVKNSSGDNSGTGTTGTTGNTGNTGSTGGTGGTGTVNLPDTAIVGASNFSVSFKATVDDKGNNIYTITYFGFSSLSYAVAQFQPATDHGITIAYVSNGSTFSAIEDITGTTVLKPSNALAKFPQNVTNADTAKSLKAGYFVISGVNATVFGGSAKSTIYVIPTSIGSDAAGTITVDRGMPGTATSAEVKQSLGTIAAPQYLGTPVTIVNTVFH